MWKDSAMMSSLKYELQLSSVLLNFNSDAVWLCHSHSPGPTPSVAQEAVLDIPFICAAVA